MRTQLRSLLYVLFAFAAQCSGSFAGPARAIQSSPARAVSPAFVRNAGLANPAARFISVGGGQPIFFTANDVRMVDPRQQRSLWLMFVDGEARALDGEAPTGGRVTVLRRANPASDAMYGEVVYRRVWPDIDARVSAAAGGIKYTFEIAPGGDPRRIHLRYSGADRITLTPGGELRLDAGETTLVDSKPVASQLIGGRTIPVEVRFVHREGDVTFAIGKYDRTRPLTIDPTLVYSTYLGSSGNDIGRAIAVDSAGAAYVAGSSNYFDLPVTPGAYQTTWHGDPNTVMPDAFIAKINPAGTHFDYVTYLGGTSPDEATGIAVDAGGNAYVTGYTRSSDFPVTSGAYRTTNSAGQDGFLTKLNSSGSALVYSTFLGADQRTLPNSVALDSGGNAYVAGWTWASNLPVSPGANPFQGSPFGVQHAFLLKLSASGDAVTYGTYIGSGGGDVAFGVATTGSGTAFVAGTTMSFDAIAGNTISDTNGQVIQGTLNGPVYKSTDGGQTFTNANTRTKSSSAFAIDPTNPSTVYQGTFDTGVLKTTDGGAHWTIASSTLGANTRVVDLVVNPATPSTLLATASNNSAGGIFRSTDSGATWTQVSTTGGYLAFAPLTPSIVYSSTNGVLKSVDGGATWTRVFTAPSGVPVGNLAVDPSNASIVYVAYNFGQVLKTTNGGATWTALTAGPAFSATAAVAVDPTLTSVVWAGDAVGHLFRSVDGGTSWGQETTAPALTGISRMVFDGGTLYVSEDDRPFDNFGTANAGIVKTSDRGATWSPLKIRGNALAVRGLAALNGLVYAGGDIQSDAFLWRVDTNDGAQAFKFGTYLGGGGSDIARGVAVDKSGNAVVVVETDSGDYPFTYVLGKTNAGFSRISPDGIHLIVSGYVGDPFAFTTPAAVAVDANNDAFIAETEVGGVRVERSRPDGAIDLHYFLQGTHSNVGNPNSLPLGIAAGPIAGAVFVAGFTNTIDFPTTANAPQPSYGSGAGDAFIAELFFEGTSGQPSPNLALQRPVVASSEFGPQYAASFAVDGDLSTRWSSQFSDPQWIYVDLGQTYAINSVILRWETAYGANYEVQVSNDATNWTPIRAVFSGRGGIDDLVGLSGTGRYVRIYGTQRGTEWGYSLWELEVYGNPTTPPPSDIALGKPVVTSSDFSAQYAGGFAVDGDSSTRWSSAFSDPQWIYVDLGQRYAVNRVKLSWEAAYGADFQIQVSDDAVSWRSIAVVTNNNSLTDDFLVLAVGRYVRMFGTRRGTEWGYSLFSFEIYGDPAPRSPDRGLNRPAVSSSDFSPAYAAAFAVDGDPSTRWSSQFSDPQWIYVDLGQRFAINEIVLSWETAYGADFEIQVSDDASSWSKVASLTDNAGGVNDLAVTGTGRYVRIYGTRRGTEWGYSLWSFEVYGDPAP
jgi:hypothetical protein